LHQNIVTYTICSGNLDAACTKFSKQEDEWKGEHKAQKGSKNHKKEPDLKLKVLNSLEVHLTFKNSVAK